VARHLHEEQKADEVYTYKEDRGIDQFANAVAEAFKKANSQIRCVVVPRSTLGDLGLKKRLEKRKDLGVKVEVLYLPKYYAEYYKHIDR
jgi:hypothetical protein